MIALKNFGNVTKIVFQRRPNKQIMTFASIRTPREDRQTTYEFVDRATIVVKGGRGGNGCISFEVMSPGCKSASGGSGGKGGNVYIIADPEINSLKFQTFHYTAHDGKHGGSAGLTGRNGRDVYVKVPIGTAVSEKVSEDFYEVLEEEGYEDVELPSVRLDKPRQTLQVVEGGKAGVGNAVLSKSKRQRSTPTTKMPGEPGQSKVLHLELKIIADVGLVGFPNAGKSSLVRALSNATPKVDSYPFTTLHPSIGVVEYSDMDRITIADIPGLIDGAHENRGLGHEFLKHIERTKVLLYVLDMAGVDERRPFEDLSALIHELKMYDETLLSRPAMIFANKYDLKVGKVNQRKMEALAAEHNLKIVSGSAQSGDGLAEIARELRLMVQELRVKEAEAAREAEEEVKRLVAEARRRDERYLIEGEEEEVPEKPDKRNVGRH